MALFVAAAPMPPSLEKRSVQITISSLLTYVGTTVVVLFGGFWAFYTYNTSNLRTDYQEQLKVEKNRIQESSAQSVKTQQAAMESVVREKEATLASEQKEHLATIQETKLRNEASITRLEDNARRDHESLSQVIDHLRHQLSVSRSTLEIRADGEFMSIDDLMLEEPAAVKRMAAGAFVNVRRMVLPDYSEVGWQKLESISLAQVDAYIRERTIKLPPVDYNPNQIEWQPLFTIWTKDSKSSVGVVGAAQLTTQEFTEVLRKANTTTETVTKNKDGTDQKETKTTTIDAKKLADIPLGLSAYAMLHGMIFAQKSFGDADVSVSSFSARTNAMHFAGTVTPPDGPRFDLEVLILQDTKHIFVLFDSHSADNSLDPVSRETAGWLRAVRIVK